MTDLTENLGLRTRLKADFQTATEKVSTALKAEGFGVLTEIDVKATFKQKLDIDYKPYVILGACNPPLAHRALEAVPDVGMLLPCNVTIAQIDSDTIEVAAVNPLSMLGIISDETLWSVAKEAHERLVRVIESLTD
jgi:uncharacterized protein (DUF302 family)